MNKFTDFKKKIKPASEQVARALNLTDMIVKGYDLFTPAKSSRDYAWTKVFNADALLVGTRPVKQGRLTTAAYDKVRGVSKVRVGVIVQSEWSTAQELGNPLGKASASHFPDGLWLVQDDAITRLDRVHVLFIVPEPGAGDSQEDNKKFERALTLTTLAAQMMPHCQVIRAPVDCTEAALVELIKSATSKAFRGPGKPKGSKKASKKKTKKKTKRTR